MGSCPQPISSVAAPACSPPLAPRPARLCERTCQEYSSGLRRRRGGARLWLWSCSSSSQRGALESWQHSSPTAAAAAAADGPLAHSRSSKTVSSAEPKASFGVQKGELPELEEWLQKIGVLPARVPTVLKGLPSGLVTRLRRSGWESFLQTKVYALKKLGLVDQDVVRAIVAYPNVLSLNVDMMMWKGQNLAYFLGVEIVRGEPIPRPSVNYTWKFQGEDTDTQLASTNDVSFSITSRSRNTQQSRQRSSRQSEKEKSIILRDIVVKFPQILGLSLEQNILPFLDELRSVLKISCTKEIGRIVARNPSMIGCNQSRLRKRLKDFEDMGFQEREARLIIARHPSTIMYRTETMKRKFKFLEDLARVGDFDPHKFIILHSSFFGYSLEGRIIPRISFLVQMNMKLPSTSSFSTLCTYTDEKWCRLRLGINPEIYTEFKEKYKASQIARALKGSVISLSNSIRTSFQSSTPDGNVFQ